MHEFFFYSTSCLCLSFSVLCCFFFFFCSFWKEMSVRRSVWVVGIVFGLWWFVFSITFKYVSSVFISFMYKIVWISDIILYLWMAVFKSFIHTTICIRKIHHIVSISMQKILPECTIFKLFFLGKNSRFHWTSNNL